MYYKLGRAGRALDRFGVIEFATTIAPGVRDVLLTGKVYEAARRNARDKKAPPVRRDRARRPADRADQPVPQRQRRARRTRQGGPDQEPGRHRDDAVPVPSAPRCTSSRSSRRCRSRRRPTASTELRAARLPVGGVIVNMVRPRDLAAADLKAARGGTIDRERVTADLKRPASTSTTSWSTALLLGGPRPRRAPRPRGRAAHVVAGPRRAGVRAPAAADGVDLGASLRAGRPLKNAGSGMSTPPRSRPRVGPLAATHRPAPRRLDIDALLDDPATGIIVCCGSGGVGKTTTSAALALRAAERGRKVVVLTIDPARRLAQSMGIEAARQHPAPGAWRRRASGRQPRRDDARHEAHLRRGGARARPPRRRPQQILENPFYIALSSSFAGTAGVHGDGEARPDPRRRRSRTAATT